MQKSCPESKDVAPMVDESPRSAAASGASLQEKDGIFSGSFWRSVPYSGLAASESDSEYDDDLAGQASEDEDSQSDLESEAGDLLIADNQDLSGPGQGAGSSLREQKEVPSQRSSRFRDLLSPMSGGTISTPTSLTWKPTTRPRYGPMGHAVMDRSSRFSEESLQRLHTLLRQRMTSDPISRSAASGKKPGPTQASPTFGLSRSPSDIGLGSPPMIPLPVPLARTPAFSPIIGTTLSPPIWQSGRSSIPSRTRTSGPFTSQANHECGCSK